MKIFILPLIIICFFTTFSFAQKHPNRDTGKYNIHLPGYWKPGDPVWKVLADKLPVVCEKLKGKEFCSGDCDPEYSIEFAMSDPTVYSYEKGKFQLSENLPPYPFDCQTFSFECSLLLMNKKNDIIEKFEVIDSNEVWLLLNRENAQMAGYSIKTLYVPHIPTPDEITYRAQLANINWTNPDKQANQYAFNPFWKIQGIKITGAVRVSQSDLEPLATVNLPQQNQDINLWKKVKLTQAYMFDLIDRRINSW
jgi:hypothetical protein